MTENNRNNNTKILLTDAPSKLREARNIAKNVPYELHDLCDYLANVSNENINTMGMLILLAYTLEELEKERCGFANKVEFPQKLKN